MSHLIAFDGKVHVNRAMCSTCIFRPGNLMNLNPGRVEGMIEEIERDQGCIPCHQTLDEDFQAVCRGQFDRHKTQPLQIAERLGFIEFVERGDKYMNPDPEKPHTEYPEIEVPADEPGGSPDPDVDPKDDPPEHLRHNP